MVDGSDISSTGESASISVETDDIVQACVKWLGSKTDLVEMLGDFSDAEYSPSNDPYLFQWQMGVVLETSQKAAVVVSQMGSWAAPNVHNTMRFPRLSIDIWVDPIRDAGLSYINPAETRRRINALYLTIDKYMHRPQGGEQIWGTLRTIDCTRLGDINIYPVPDGDNMLRGSIFYGCIQG